MFVEEQARADRLQTDRAWILVEARQWGQTPALARWFTHRRLPKAFEIEPEMMAHGFLVRREMLRTWVGLAIVDG